MHRCQEQREIESQEPLYPEAVQCQCQSSTPANDWLRDLFCISIQVGQDLDLILPISSLLKNTAANWFVCATWAWSIQICSRHLYILVECAQPVAVRPAIAYDGNIHKLYANNNDKRTKKRCPPPHQYTVRASACTTHAHIRIPCSNASRSAWNEVEVTHPSIWWLPWVTTCLIGSRYTRLRRCTWLG